MATLIHDSVEWIITSNLGVVTHSIQSLRDALLVATKMKVT